MSIPLRTRVQIAAERTLTRALKATGQRDRVIAARKSRERRARLAAEAAGDHSLSHPALHDLDRKLDAIIDRDGGFFIEAGANDGVTQSNTYWLERFRQWRGLLVEPMAELHAEAVVNRPEATVVQAALVPLDQDGATVRMHFGELMSVVDGSRGAAGAEADWVAPGLVLGWRDGYTADVPARSLSSLLDEVGVPAEIDLLSLDVEGYEPQVLQGLDLARHAPRWILVEVHDVERGRAPVEAVLGDHYVLHGALSPLDLLYRRADVPAPAASARA
jgi:FkbM family methyltransferase